MLRVGETLWRRAAESSSAAAGVQLLKDGVGCRPAGSCGTPQPPLLQLARIRGSCSGTQEEVCVASGSGGGAAANDLDLEMGHASVMVEIRVRPGGAPRTPQPVPVPPLAAAAVSSPKPGVNQHVCNIKAWPLEDDDAASVQTDTDGPADTNNSIVHQQQQQQQQPAAARQHAASRCSEGDDGLCTICCDRPATCVLLECGHAGFCWRCAHVLYVRPPNECPVCRARIELVLELSDPHVPLGSRAPVVELNQGRERGVWGRAVAGGSGCLGGCGPCPGGGGQVQPLETSADRLADQGGR